MALEMADQHFGYPEAPRSGTPRKRKWRDKSARQNNHGYARAFHEGMNEQVFKLTHLKEFRNQDRMKSRRCQSDRRSVPRTVPRPPFNDSSFLIMRNMDQRPPSSPADSLERLEQRIGWGVSRFEMRELTRQDKHRHQMEVENLVLQDRLLLIQQEIDELRQRLPQQ